MIEKVAWCGCAREYIRNIVEYVDLYIHRSTSNYQHLSILQFPFLSPDPSHLGDDSGIVLQKWPHATLEQLPRREPTLSPNDKISSVTSALKPDAEQLHSPYPYPYPPEHHTLVPAHP